MAGVVAVLLSACAACADRAIVQASERHIGRVDLGTGEGIFGRVVRGRELWLFTSALRLVVFDLESGSSRVIPVTGVDSADGLAGFAQGEGNSFWTLSGWHTLIELDANGAARRTVTLEARHASVFSGPAGRLVFQLLDFTPGAAALVTGAAGSLERTPIGNLRVPEGEGPAVLRWGQAYVVCGLPAGELMPCWLANRAIVNVLDARGGGRLLHVAPLEASVLSSGAAFARTPRRVIRDAAILPDGVVVLGPASPEEAEMPGGRGVWWLTYSGAIARHRLFARRLRMIVEASPGSLTLLTQDGDVVRVEG